MLVHVAAVVMLFSLPKGFFEPPPRTAQVQITTLIEPLTALTQNAPNKAKLNKEFNATEVHPRPRIQVPMGLPFALPQAPRPAEPKPAPPAAGAAQGRGRRQGNAQDGAAGPSGLPPRRRRFSPWKPPSWRSKPPARRRLRFRPGNAVWPCRTRRYREPFARPLVAGPRED